MPGLVGWQVHDHERVAGLQEWIARCPVVAVLGSPGLELGDVRGDGLETDSEGDAGQAHVRIREDDISRFVGDWTVTAVAHPAKRSW